ncbi:MAG: hypothetical protein ACRD7E_02170, partial [Bryobacteraceae bacterium]
MTDDVRKLLGGYAANTLTEEERKALFAAALDDQDLFEAMADEQALRELLDDPSARAQLLGALEPRRVPVWMRFRYVAGAAACAVLAVVLVTLLREPALPPAEMAKLRTPPSV